MKKSLFLTMLVCAGLMLLSVPAQAAQNDYHVYGATNLTLSGAAATGTVVNSSYAVMEVFSIGCSITDTNAGAATDTITLSVTPYGETTAYKVTGCPAQVEGSENTTAISTNTVPFYLFRGDQLNIGQAIANTNGTANVSAKYHLKYGGKR